MMTPIRYSRCFVSRPIGEALSADAFERCMGAFSIGNLAMIPAEIEFLDVALQVLFSDMVERPDQATLEQGEIAFDVVGMRSVAEIKGTHTFI